MTFTIGKKMRNMQRFYKPVKQSILEAIEHLLAKYLEIRPLFFLLARPINDE